MLYEVITELRRPDELSHSSKRSRRGLVGRGDGVVADGVAVEGAGRGVEGDIAVVVVLVELVGVITSYSIHYTKLYDAAPLRIGARFGE